jgi:hypothetical protein
MRRTPASPLWSPSPEIARVATLDADLARVAGSVGLIGAVTPANPQAEHARLLVDFMAGRERMPAWTYQVDTELHAGRLRAVDDILARLRAEQGSPLGALYIARAEEVRREIDVALAVGTPSFAARAGARFPACAERVDADALARRLIQEPGERPPGPLIRSDDRDPRSLASRMRAEVSRRLLPFQVRTSAFISAAAAISGDTIWVAEGRRMTEADAIRTVVHEIEGHAVPRTRARSRAVGLFAIGTATGIDDQEGYALWVEQDRGVCGPNRRWKLGWRHLAAARMTDGADFVSVVRSLRGDGADLDSALRAAERTFRGSHGATPGLGRERVYLEALLRVRQRLTARPGDEKVLASGQVAVAAIDTLRGWA